MPKIPLYNQGAGPTAGIASGKLSPGISISTATAPGRAYAGFQKTFSDAGNVAQQFALREKEAQTTEARSDLTLKTKERWDEFNRTNTAQTVPEYEAQASAFQSQLQEELLGGYEGFTRSQKANLSQSFNQLSIGFSLAGKQASYNRNLVNRGRKQDEFIQATMETMRGLDPSDPTYEFLQASLAQSFSEARTQGLPLEYDERKVLKDLSAGNFESEINAAQTVEDIERLKKKNEDDVTLNADEKQQNRSLLHTAKTRIEADIQDKLLDSTLETIARTDFSKLTPEALQESKESLLNGEPLNVVNPDDPDGPLITIDSSKLKPEKRLILVNQMETLFEAEESNRIKVQKQELRSLVNNASLSELNQMMQDAQNNKGFFEGNDNEALRNAAQRIIQTEIDELSPKVISETSTAMSNLTAKINVQNGEINEDDLKEIGRINSQLIDAGLFSEAAKFKEDVSILRGVNSLFNELEFASSSQMEQAILEQKRILDDNPTFVQQQIIEKLTTKLQTSRKEMEKDFVGYYNKQRPEDPLSVAELKSLQIKLGIEPSNIRVTSEGELDAFMAAYNSAESLDEKYNVSEQFFSQYGEDEYLVTKHLRETNRISVMENMIMAYGDDVNLRLASEYNSEENIKDAKDKTTSVQRTDVRTALNENMSSFSSSMLGGLSDGVTSPATTEKRIGFVNDIDSIIYNTALGLLANSRVKTADEAVEQAYNSVIGNRYVFHESNGKSMIRMPSELSFISQDITDVLDISLTRNEEYLSSILEKPPIPFGASGSQEMYDNEYISDIISSSYWVTNENEDGVYLVDQTGNKVTRKPELVGGVPGMETRFIEVKFEDVIPLARVHQESGMGGDNTGYIGMGAGVRTVEQAEELAKTVQQQRSKTVFDILMERQLF